MSTIPHDVNIYKLSFADISFFTVTNRSTIRNAQSIHPKGRQRISQDSYRRQSRRFLQQRGRLNSQSKDVTRSPLQERKPNRGVYCACAKSKIHQDKEKLIFYFLFLVLFLYIWKVAYHEIVTVVLRIQQTQGGLSLNAI